jgi:hypothetical protein
MSDAAEAGKTSEGGDLKKILTACSDRPATPTASHSQSSTRSGPSALSTPITTDVINRHTSYRKQTGGDAPHDALTDLHGFYEALGDIDAFTGGAPPRIRSCRHCVWQRSTRGGAVPGPTAPNPTHLRQVRNLGLVTGERPGVE